jgi:trimethylamine--corrinoid protein Co-methyltransferase
MNDKHRSNIPRLNILSQDKIELLHLSTLEILRRTGIAVKERKALDVFKKSGCFIDGDRVRISAHLVEWALKNVPSRICLCDRNLTTL